MSKQSIWVALIAILASTNDARTQERAISEGGYREIRGPKGSPDRRSIFAHMDQAVFTRDGSKVAAGAGANIYVWNVADGKELVRMQLPEEQIYHRLVFSEDGKKLIWCGLQDPMMRVWDVATGRQLREFRQPYTENPLLKEFSSQFLNFSRDGKRAAFVGVAARQGVDILDIETGKISLKITDQRDCRGCEFSMDGKMLAVHSSGGDIRVWDAHQGKLLRELRADRPGELAGYRLMSISPDGRFLATSGVTRSPLEVWSLETGKRVCTVPARIYFYGAAFSPDGLTVLCVEPDGRPYFYHLVAEKVTLRFDPPSGGCHFVTFSPDFKTVALIGNATGRDSNVRHEAIFLYDVSAKAFTPSSAAVDDAPLERLFDDLGTSNELRLQRILQAFRTAPQAAVAALRTKVRPVSKQRQETLEKSIGNLDAAAPETRDNAMKELQEAVHDFAPLLEAQVKAASAGEIRNRLTFVRNKAESEPLPISLVREMRAVALLEELGTAEAKELLTQLIDGAPQARLTLEAKAALDRLAKKKGASK